MIFFHKSPIVMSVTVTSRSNAHTNLKFEFISNLLFEECWISLMKVLRFNYYAVFFGNSHDNH